jgi:hypothetical protein
MKFLLSVFLSLFFLPALKAQTIDPNSASRKGDIEYLSPGDGESYVFQRATIIVRPSKQIIGSHSVRDFSFSISGDISGVHNGTVAISDDNQTITFLPDKPFALNEIVNATFSIAHAEDFAPLSYRFYITPMSDGVRRQALSALSQKIQEDYQTLMQSSASLPMGTDTIAFSPAVVVIDTMTTHEDGNIFFSPTGSIVSPFSFLAITSDTATESFPDSNNFLFLERVNVGCGNFRMQPDGTLTFFREYSSPTGGIFAGRIDHLDKNMHLIDTFQFAENAAANPNDLADLHDFQLLPNGHAILVSYDPRYINMKDTLLASGNASLIAIAPKADTNELVFGAIIQELDQNKNMIFQWRSWDHLKITDAAADIHMVPANPKDTIIDYVHINTAILDPKDNTIIASFRHQDEVAKISRTDGSFIWQWGGKHNQFSFSGPNPGDTTKFSHQHDPERIANGDITLFDNGNLRLKDTTIAGKDTVVNHPFTRALEYSLDEVNHKATVIWQYDSIPFCAAAGNVQRLANGNSMIGLGIVVQPSAIEVTPTGQRIFQMSIQKGAFSYRTYRFPFTPPLAVHQISSDNFPDIKSIYPNPAQTNATVYLTIEKSGLLTIDLLDVLGHTVRSKNEILNEAGSYTLDLDLHDLPSGTYYCKLSQNGNHIVRMIGVLK